MGVINERCEYFNQESAVLAAATQTGVLGKTGFSPVGVIVTAAFVPTAITFQTGINPTDLRTVKNENGTTYTLTVGGEGYYLIPPWVSSGWQFLRLLFNAAAGADQNVIVVWRPV